MLVTHQSTFVHRTVLCIIPNNESNSELNKLETFRLYYQEKKGGGYIKDMVLLLLPSALSSLNKINRPGNSNNFPSPLRYYLLSAVHNDGNCLLE